MRPAAHGRVALAERRRPSASARGCPRRWSPSSCPSACPAWRRSRDGPELAARSRRRRRSRRRPGRGGARCRPASASAGSGSRARRRRARCRGTRRTRATSKLGSAEMARRSSSRAPPRRAWRGDQRAARGQVREQDMPLEVEVDERVEPAVGVVRVLLHAVRRRPRRSSRTARRRASWSGWPSSTSASAGTRGVLERLPRGELDVLRRVAAEAVEAELPQPVGVPLHQVLADGGARSSRRSAVSVLLVKNGRHVGAASVDSVRKSGSELSCRVSSVLRRPGSPGSRRGSTPGSTSSPSSVEL